MTVSRKVSSLARSAAQPGPGAIPHTVSPYVCIDLVNSRFADHTGSGDVYDRIEMQAWQRWFAQRCDLKPLEPPAGAVLRSLIRLRALLRTLLEFISLPAPARWPN